MSKYMLSINNVCKCVAPEVNPYVKRYFHACVSSNSLPRWTTNVHPSCKPFPISRFAPHQKCSFSVLRSLNQQLSPTLQKHRKRNVGKLNYPLKSTKRKTDIILNVWKDITVRELASVMGKDLGHVFDAMSFVKNSMYYDHPDAAIDDMSVIMDILKRSGMRGKVTAPPKTSAVIQPVKDIVSRPPADPTLLVKRPPVVTIMGHVDHGKTTLLDYLRKSAIVDQEFGGITQHIGAFTVDVGGDSVTFLDTPGHAAFSAMRARGAKITDLVVLVVAADDGVMEQTMESVRYSTQANVPIIVAINKIDKPEADIESCKQSLMKCGIQPEEFGGDVQCVPLSALKGTNVDQLVEAIIAQTDLMQLKSDPRGMVEGVIVESKVDTRRGKLATVLVKRGTLKKGDIIIAGTAWAKVRGMFNSEGLPVTCGHPSQPVEVIGWRNDENPTAGDVVLQAESEKSVKIAVNFRLDQRKNEKMKEDFVAIEDKVKDHTRLYKAQLEKRRSEGRRMTSLSDWLMTQPETSTETVPNLSVVLKGDVNGSIEAILNVLSTYRHHHLCKMDIIQYGVGEINENDIEMAEAFNATIYGFNVGAPKAVVEMAKEHGIIVKMHNVIYRLVDEIKDDVNNLILPKWEEEIIGEATVLKKFLITERKKKVPVAGCSCTKGILKKDAFYRINREMDKIYEGRLAAMKHMKNEVNSIKVGVECGLMFDDLTCEILPGDVVYCYQNVQVPQKISWDPGF